MLSLCLSAFSMLVALLANLLRLQLFSVSLNLRQNFILTFNCDARMMSLMEIIAPCH